MRSPYPLSEKVTYFYDLFKYAGVLSLDVKGVGIYLQRRTKKQCQQSRLTLNNMKMHTFDFQIMITVDLVKRTFHLANREQLHLYAHDTNGQKYMAIPSENGSDHIHSDDQVSRW